MSINLISLKSTPHSDDTNKWPVQPHTPSQSSQQHPTRTYREAEHPATTRWRHFIPEVSMDVLYSFYTYG